MSISPVDPVPVALTASEAATIRQTLSGLARQRDQRWRTSHFGRNGVIALLVCAIVANLLWIFGLENVMQPLRLARAPQDAIQVSVIEPLPDFEVPPEPEPQPVVFQRRASAVKIAPPETRITPPPLNPDSASQTQARIGTAGEAAPTLFNADGSLRMPKVETRIGPEKIENPQEAAKARWAEIRARGENPLDCTRTRFASQFRADQSAGDRIAGKYLSWIGLADQQGITERAAEREQRAADGCDPPPKRE